jgi:two-component system, OmpR family, phosphate regulon sensor histidine kinase PhoR
LIGNPRRLLSVSRGPVRLLLAMVLLALPLAAGVWAFADFAGRSGEQRADAQLQTLLHSTLQEYGEVVGAAGTRATAVAARRDVQLALLRGDRARLAAVARTMPGTSFELRGGATVGTVRRPAAVRSVEVVVGGRRVGRVVVGLTLDRALLDRLARKVRLPAGDRLVLRAGPASLKRSTVRVAGSDYRYAAAALVGGRHATRLLVLEPASKVAGSAAHLRGRVLLAGLVALVSLVLLVYLFAPAIAHGRLLSRQRDQAARVLSHLGEGVFLVDDGGTVRLWNPSAEAITGIAADAVRGRPAAGTIPGWSTLQAAIPVEEERARPATLPLVLGDRKLWLSISGVRFTEGIVYAFRDLTEERRLEQMRSDFVATVSHELRTPLAAIHGAVLTLSKRGSELGPALQDSLLGIVVEQSERLSELVEQILLAAQLDSGGLRLARERFDGAVVARNVIVNTRPRVPAGVTLELAAPVAAASVVGDPDKTRHVLSNLIDNAIKYSPDGGRIDVIIASEEDRLRFTVRDEGLGIPPGEQERIFEKFYRLDAAMSRGVGGSGLGLYICRELVRRMDGRIWVSSEPGAGSSFSFDLPLAGAA